MKSEWNKCVFGDIVNFSSGGTPNKSIAEYWNGDIPWISAKTMKHERISSSDLYITEEGLQHGSKLANPGSILFLVRGSGLFNGIPVCMVVKPVAYNQDVKCIESCCEVENKYIFYWLLSKTKILKSLVGTTTIGAGKFDMDQIKQLEFCYPDKKSRENIVDFAEAISLKIEINNRINDNLLQQAMALYKAWFVYFEPFGGSKPEYWVETTLESVSSLITRGIAPNYDDDSDQIVINQKCIRNHMLDLQPARQHRPKVINEKWLKYGDLLVNSTGEGTLGRVAQVYFEPHNMTVDSHVTIVRPNSERLIFYIGMWGLTHEREIESLHTGSTGQTELPRDRVKSIEILLPDDKTLCRFNDAVAPMTRMIVNNQDENTRLAVFRDSLLPKLMSGEIDVSDISV